MLKQKVFLILVIVLISFSSYAQSYKITGKVTDTLDTPMVGATIVLLTAQDSLLKYFTSADKNGEYELNPIPKGEYIFQASYTSYDKFEKSIDIQGTNRTIEMDVIKLEAIAYDLKTVEIEGERVPVQFINDTLIYDANAFDPGKNNTVEDLLKKMPGIEVDEKGDIKAQGKDVQKVTVDGKEFFGNDPKMATQNLPAEAVDKVKVFDKKSDFTEATGIEDGKEEKTIDLELKEDHKNGFFGKVTGGYGTENSYSLKANINRFSPKTRISLIGKTNNTSKEGFDFNDILKMSGGFEEMLGSNGDITFDGGMMGSRDGINKPIDGGINFNYSPVKKINLNASYFINKGTNFTLLNKSTNNFFPNLKYSTTNNYKKNLNYFNHNVNAILKIKINERSNLKWNIKYINSESDNSSLDTLNTFNEFNDIENDKFGFESKNTIGANTGSYLSYNLKFKKEGRSIFTKISGNYKEKTSNRHINSINTYYDKPIEERIDSIYQDHNNLTNNQKYRFSLAFTEPLWKMTYLIVDFSHNLSSNEYNRKLNDKFPIYENEEFKQDIYNSDFNYSTTKTSFKYNGIRHQFDLGIKYQNSIQKGDYISNDDYLENTYSHWLPSMNYSYKISKNSTFKARYYSDVKAPSILQLLPIIDNSNPQYIVLGNENLEPEKNNNLNLNYNNWNSFNETNTWVSLRGSLVENTIVNSRIVDSLYRTTSKPINTGVSERANFHSSHTRPLKLLKSKISFKLSGSYNDESTLINGIENDYQKLNYSIGSDIHNYNNKYVTGKIGFDYSTTLSKYSINTESDNTYNKIKYFLNVKWKITKNIKLSNSIKYITYSNKYSDDADDEILWNTSVKFFLKDKRFIIELAANDLLNQTLGYRQYSGDNYIQYTKSNRIGRYFMLSVTYSLKKFKGPNQDTIIIFND